MSAIFGIVHFDGRPVSPASLAALDAALSGWGPDGGMLWQSGSAAVGFRLLATTPEAHHERMPILLPDGAVVVAAARLDNRDELCDEFSVASALRPSTTDGALVAMAYERWGTQCSPRLLGDWALAAWDPARRRLFLARDQLGVTGLHYHQHQDGNGFAFATTAAALGTISSASRSIDDEYLARWFGECLEDLGSTIWKGVRRLPPAYSLVATAEGSRVDRYWSVEQARPVRLRDEREYVSAFMEHYRRAVRCRLRAERPIGSTLSAGFDSSSVTLLAAEALAARGERLVALTAVPRHGADHLVPGRLADEWPLAAAVAARYPEVIEHVAIGRNAMSPLDAIDAGLAALAEPQPSPGNTFWILAMLAEASQRGIRVVLTGQHGNAGISWAGGAHRVAYLLAERNWSRGLEELAQLRRKKRVSWPRIIAGQIVRPLLRSLPRPAWSPEWAGGGHRIDPIIDPHLVRRFNLPEKIRPLPLLPPSGEREPMLLSGALAGTFWQAWGAAFGVEVRDPTGDLRLIEYCLGVPDEQHVWQGVPRALLRRAMQGRLPEELLANTRRGRQGADVALRLLSEPEPVNAEVEALALNPALAGRLRGDALRDSWRSVQADPGLGGQFLRGMMAAKLLRRAGQLEPLP